MEDIGNGQTVAHVACVGLSIRFTSSISRMRDYCLGLNSETRQKSKTETYVEIQDSGAATGDGVVGVLDQIGTDLDLVWGDEGEVFVGQAVLGRFGDIGSGALGEIGGVDDFALVVVEECATTEDSDHGGGDRVGEIPGQVGGCHCCCILCACTVPRRYSTENT